MPHRPKRKGYHAFDSWLDKQPGIVDAFDLLTKRQGYVSKKQESHITDFFDKPILKQEIKGREIFRYRRSVDKHKRGQFAKRSAFEAQ